MELFAGLIDVTMGTNITGTLTDLDFLAINGLVSTLIISTFIFIQIRKA